MLNRLQGVFASFQSHDVRYVVPGGIAAVLHGVPRATFDLDILVEASRDNVERLLNALEAAGLGTAALTTVDDVPRTRSRFSTTSFESTCRRGHQASNSRRPGRAARP
jgi:hypothetical protein